MGRLFDLDSPIMSFLGKVADLIWLNILTLICCIPIVTVGASLTAMNYVVLKMVRNEEGYVTKSFFKSFKQNFRQATIIWLILLLLIIVLAADFLVINYSTVAFPNWLQAVLIGLCVIILFAVMHLFPVLSKFENTVMHTFKNSFLMGILALPKTVLMMVLWVIPILIAIFFPQILPIVICLGISAPGYVCAMLYNKTFKRFEPEEETTSGDDWFIEPIEGEEGAEGSEALNGTAEEATSTEAGTTTDEEN